MNNTTFTKLERGMSLLKIYCASFKKKSLYKNDEVLLNLMKFYCVKTDCMCRYLQHTESLLSKCSTVSFKDNILVCVRLDCDWMVTSLERRKIVFKKQIIFPLQTESNSKEQSCMSDVLLSLFLFQMEVNDCWNFWLVPQLHPWWLNK